MAAIFNNKFCNLLDFEILESGLPLYQYGLGSRLTYELTFADYSEVIKALGADPDASYTIFNISIKFDTITNALLASQIRTEKKAAFHMTEFSDNVLLRSMILIQVFQWI